VVELPFAADCCPWVEKLRTVLPFTVGFRDGVVHLVSTLGSVVISARAEQRVEGVSVVEGESSRSKAG
jgi:hypothetical protein